MGGTRPVRRWTLGVVAAIGAMALAGCSSSLPDYNDAVGRSSPPGTEAPMVGLAYSTATTSGPLGRARPPVGTLPAVPNNPGNPPVPGRTTPPGSESASPFCADAATLQGLITSLLSAVASPAELNRSQALLAKLAKDAPPELHTAVQALVQLQDRISKDLGAKPPNSADIITVFTDPGYQQSIQQILTYSISHCSIDFTPPTS